MQHLTLFNASPERGSPAALRIAGGRICAGAAAPQPGDLAVDLRGDRLLPGLINAHDHLQLNALPRLGERARYTRAGQWIADIEPRLRTDTLLLANAAVPRAQRLLIGGVKNLLSGVTTVAHHDPLYPALSEAGFPVRVPSRYGWSHSLGLDGAAAVRSAHRQTPADRPWIIHAAEGTDEVAAAEFEQLDALGCLTPNTLLVHGVALDEAQQRRLLRSGAGLIWCPSSNLHLFGRSLDVRHLFEQRRVALGSDSRISGAPDLLAELRVARALAALDDAELESLVTERAAALLRLPDRGALAAGTLGDLLVLPRGLPLAEARRADIRLVLVGGEPRYADPDYAQAFEHAGLVPVQVDGRPKYLAPALAAALRACAIGEPGLALRTALPETCT